jgi:hypothetical protein
MDDNASELGKPGRHANFDRHYAHLRLSHSMGRVLRGSAAYVVDLLVTLPAVDLGLRP